eukprot:Selendium_serpulae@DN2830_c1_g1_i1.p1
MSSSKSSSRDERSVKGDQVFAKMEKVSSELLALTYGALVTQLLKDVEHVENVNMHLDMIGWNIGSRLVDEFFAKSGLGTCRDFRDTAEVVGKVGFKMFLGITAEVRHINAWECSLVLRENPLMEFVELPASLANLSYSNILCGIIRGALEQVHMKVRCYFVKDMFKGASENEIRIDFKEFIKEGFVDDED